MLPERYRDDRLFALALDPHRLFIYWEEGMAVSQIAGRYLAAGWESAPRQLRVRGSSGDEKKVVCAGDSGSHYVDGLHAGAHYRVEYGLVQEGRFLPLFESRVRLPGTGSSRLPASELTERISSYTLYDHL